MAASGREPDTPAVVLDDLHRLADDSGTGLAVGEEKDADRARAVELSDHVLLDYGAIRRLVLRGAAVAAIRARHRVCAGGVCVRAK